MLGKFLSALLAALRLIRKPTDFQSKEPLRVSVLIAQPGDGEQHQLLVFPEGAPSDVPNHLQDLNWKHLATTTLGEKLLAPAAPVIEAEILMNGYSLLTLTR